MPGALAQLLVRERSAKQGWNKSEKETVERMVQISKKRQLEEDEEEGEGENGGEKSQGRKKGRVDELDRTESRFRRLEITDQEEMEESHKRCGSCDSSEPSLFWSSHFRTKPHSSHTKSSDSAPSLSAQPFDLSKTRRILFPESLSFKDDMDTDADMQEKEFRSVPSVEDEIEDDDDF